MEGNPLERITPGIKKEDIPSLPPLDSYAEKVKNLRNLEAEIKSDEELERTLKVSPKGLNAPTAQKMLRDTIERLTKNKKKYDELMGITVQ